MKTILPISNSQLYGFRLDGNDKVSVNNSTFPHGSRITPNGSTDHPERCNRNGYYPFPMLLVKLT
jgi:hypothetical protein